MKVREKALQVVVLLLFCYSYSCRAQSAKNLAADEVGTLKAIALKLGNTNWDFSVDPCTWVGKDNAPDFKIKAFNCSCLNTTCHLTSILLKAQNLTGELPEDFANLTSLQMLDLTRNYLSGSIPKRWSSLPLTNLQLLGNKISGQIPDEIGNIITLQQLGLESNLLEGSIPESLGQLRNLTRLLLSANNLSGPLPESLGNLVKLTDFRIDGNPISGNIPSFIGNWTKLTRLDMQGTLIEGPFPTTFSSLSSIDTLHVTDWLRGNGQFPDLSNMKDMKELILRNLSLSGDLPGSISKMVNLSRLDLSFNNLTGEIPNSYSAFDRITYVLLSNNKLGGTLPTWLSNSQNWDLSYNSFNGTPTISTCDRASVNYISSYSATNSTSIATCLRRNLPCSGKAKNYKLFINCGGAEMKIGDETYQDDAWQLGASEFRQSPDQTWGVSNQGKFIGDIDKPFTTNNITEIYSNDSDVKLYTTARTTPVSLRYYGFCLQSGNYTVTLHFAEIMFANNQTFASLGRRLFDVWIQGVKFLSDFNIASEAEGVGKTITKKFTAIVDHTLEIHFQWTGKGTNAIPYRGTYGPLISAISVKPNFKPDLGGLSTGAIVGIVLSACAFVALTVALVWFCLKKKDIQDEELRGLDQLTGYFTLRQIKAATRNFDPANKIGEGGFGPVYKGVLGDGSEIAVKQLSSKSKQGNREFINEIGMISALQHPNLVKLYGCCVEGNQLLLVYEYMENNSLARALFGPERCRLKLDWQTRFDICLGVARGLAYLHEESRLKIVHRDIKATNILLDKDLNAKISDFGLAKLDEEENTHISTRIAGTIGYMAPEYAMRGYLTDKADVYSFGVVVLEVVSGVSNTNYKPKEEFVYLLDWAYVLQEEGDLLKLVDKNLGLDYSKEEALHMLNLALVCTNPSPTLRPKMSTVVSILEGKTPVKAPPIDHTKSKDRDLRFKAFERLSEDSHRESEYMWTESSASVPNSSITESNSLSATSRLLSDPGHSFN